jgi:hypothetical protein
VTDDERRNAQQRIADTRAQIRRELDTRATPSRSATDRIGAPFAVGDRVLNIRGGLEGEVDDVRPTGSDGSAWIWVRYDDGARSALRATDLIARPRPPAATR